MSLWDNIFGSGQRLVAASTTGAEAGPETPSAEWLAMHKKWCEIDDILAGADRIHAAGEKYLPRYEDESRTEFARRLAASPWRPEFADALQSLTSRPFSKPVALQGNVDPKIEAFAQDVDGRGNALGIFARQFFTGAVAKGLGAILIDYPITPNIVDGRPTTLADEREYDARPYWCQIQAENILALYAEQYGGRERVTHVRIRECSTVRDGFGERLVERIRVLELNDAGKPVWSLYEFMPNSGYQEIQSGELTLDEIPLVLLFTGERFGSYGVRPPLGNLATMQLELNRALSREDEILTYAGSPMLSAYGMQKPEGDVKVKVGPKTVLFAPPVDQGRAGWEYVSPNAATIKEVAASVERITESFRRLALQPTVQKTGNVTATATAVDASKAHSAVESWAIALKDALDQALMFTAAWMNVSDTATASVHTDFAADLSNVEQAKVLSDGSAKGIVSKKTVRGEWKRTGVLGPDFNEDEEELRLAEEQQGLEPEELINPTNGDVVPFDRMAS